MPVSTPPPSTGARPPDLSDEEFVELDDLLLETPEPLEPLDVVMLDGYLCGLLVQPVLVEQADWLPFVFDFDGRALPDGTDPAWMARTSALIVRRYEVLNRSLAEDGWFDPLILEEGEGSEPPEGEAADPMMAGLSEVSRPLMPWVAGFHHASDAFPALSELGEDDVMIAIARLFRHLPQEDDESRKLVEEIDREFPLASVDDAVAELVATVADLYELTAKQRYKVETVRRDTPKVGRNDPCFCGSGKKYKNCHGAS